MHVAGVAVGRDDDDTSAPVSQSEREQDALVLALMGRSCCPGAWWGTLNGAAPDIAGLYSTPPEASPMEPEAAPPKGVAANPLHLQKCYTDRRRGVARLTRFCIIRLVTILRSSV